MEQTRTQRSWNSADIWDEFVAHSQEATNAVEFEIDFYVHMVDFFGKTLHEMWQEKCEKLEESNRDVGEFMLCSFCNDLFVEGVTLFCGHTYCRKCLKKRESDNFIELCPKCDQNAAKYSRWFFMRRAVVDTLKKNVVLNAILTENYPNELQAINVRLDGNKRLEKSDYAQAIEKYKAAIELCPASFMSWSNLAQVKTNQQEFEEALHAAQMSIQISPSWPKGYYREGIAYRGLSSVLQSAVSFFKYLVLEPSSVSVKKLLAMCLSELVDSKCVVEDEKRNNGVEGGCVQGKEEDQLEDLAVASLALTKKQCVEDIMKEILQNGIEFCLLHNPSTRRFPAQITSQHNLEKLKNYLSCPLCCRVFYEPITTFCGHTYCVKCLERSLDFNNTCSICRTSLHEIIILKPKPVDETINMLVITYFKKEYEENKSLTMTEAQVLQYENRVEEVALIPIFVCTPVFPTTECPLHVFEPRYKLMMRRCLSSNSKVFGMCMYDEINGFADYGTLLQIRDNRYLDDGRLLVDTVGEKRFKVLERGSKDGYATARVQFFSDNATSNSDPDELRRLGETVYNESREFLSSLPNVILNTLILKYGELPTIDEGVGTEAGPKWVWFMMRLLVQNENEDVVNALKCDNYEERLLCIKENIDRMKSTIHGGS